MPLIAYLCPVHGRFERRFSIKERPPEDCFCPVDTVDDPGSDFFVAGSCGEEAPRLWEMPTFICDRADQDVDTIPGQFQVSDNVKPESAAQGQRLERAYQKKIHSRRRQIADDGGGAIKQTHSIPAHLYHGKIRQTGDKSYWLDDKNRNKHKSTRVDNYGRSRRGKG